MEFTALIAVCMSVVLCARPTEVQAWGRSAITGPGTYGVAGDPRIVITAYQTEGYQSGHDHQPAPYSHPPYAYPETVASVTGKPEYRGYTAGQPTGYPYGYSPGYSAGYHTGYSKELPDGYTKPILLPTAHDPGTIIKAASYGLSAPIPIVQPTAKYPVPKRPTIVSPTSPAAAAQTPLSGDCRVQMTFSVCSLVGKVETFHYLKRKYEAPGTLPPLDVKAKKHEPTYFAGRDECTCKTAFHITASKNVTTKEDAKFYASNMRTMIKTFITTDDKFVCIDYRTPEYAGDGCPVATDDTSVPSKLPAAASASATSNGGGPAVATATSTGGQATAIATGTATGSAPATSSAPAAIGAPTSGRCRVVKLFKLCVTDQGSFEKDLKKKQKKFANMLGLKKKEFPKDITFTDTTGTVEGFCAGKTALDALVSVPVVTSDEGDSMLQAVDSLASILIGQQLASVIGGVNGAPAVTQCV